MWFTLILIGIIVISFFVSRRYKKEEESKNEESKKILIDYDKHEMNHNLESEREDANNVFKYRGYQHDEELKEIQNDYEQRAKHDNLSIEKENAKKDMLYGALWCGGGTIATLAHIGFIFWGAIVFGAFQFLRGFFNYFSNK